MKRTVLGCVVLLWAISGTAQTIQWVGDSTACDGTTNSHNSLTAALFAALLNSQADEIRLTARSNYIGASYTLTDWDPSTTGALIIKGGYNDCQSSQSGRTLVSNAGGTVFTVQTTNRPISSVTFENLEISSGLTGILATGGAEVTIGNSLVQNNTQGIHVAAGAYVNLLASSTVQFNDDFSDINSQGGGIYCTGNNSQVDVRGNLNRNRAGNGANLYVTDQCFVELYDGVNITGNNNRNLPDAAGIGGGIAVENQGFLLGSGGAGLIRIADHNSGSAGGGIAVRNGGRATLFNTHIINNFSSVAGSAVYVSFGGNFIMDRVAPCPFLISCSKITQHDFISEVVYTRNSSVDISRTIIDQNTFDTSSTFEKGIVRNFFGSASVRLDHVGIYNNTTNVAIAVDGGSIEIAHATIARNNLNGSPAQSIVVDDADVVIENSIITDSAGAEIINGMGSITGKCNLVNFAGDMPINSYFVGTAVFNDNQGDLRQQDSSDSVDACSEDHFAWSNDVDIEFQNAPVNEMTNPQGSPGEVGGLYDAGFDEAYVNIGNDEFLISVLKAGSGVGTVNSNPTGISCGMDCNEIYNYQTVLQLIADSNPGSQFAGWNNCPNPSNDICLINVDANLTVTANFNQVDDLIFANGFD